MKAAEAGRSPPCTDKALAYIAFMPDYRSLSATEIARKVARGDFSAVEIAQQAIELARTEGKELNAFIAICEDRALRQAEAVDDAVRDRRREHGGQAPWPVCR